MLVALVFADGDTQPITVASESRCGVRQQHRRAGAGAFMSMVVPLAVFFAFQRQFVQGVMAGAER